MHAASACVRVHAVCLFHIFQKTPALYAYMVQAIPAEQELADLCPLACSLVLSRHRRACSTPAYGRYKIMGKHIVHACTLGLSACPDQLTYSVQGELHSFNQPAHCRRVY